MLAFHADLARKLDALEKKYDAQFKVVFDAIRELMKPSEPGPPKKLWGHIFICHEIHLKRSSLKKLASSNLRFQFSHAYRRP